MSKPRSWFRFENRAEDSTVADLYIYDDIGQSWWSDETVTAKAFLEALGALPKETASIVVHINSLGGDCFDAAAIANALRDQRDNKGRKVDTIVEGIAASAASVVAMAGTKVQIADNALMMIHNPWSIEMGEAKDFRAAAVALDKVRNTIITSYQWHSGQDADAIGALMDAATWMTADEAIAHGFATDKIETVKVAASISRQALDRVAVPDRFKAKVDALVQPPPAAPKPANHLDVIKACNAAGFPEMAEQLATAQNTMDQVQAALADAKRRRDESTEAERVATEAKAQRVSTITAMCKQAGHPDLAEQYVTGGMSPDMVRAQLGTLKAKFADLNIDTTIDPNRGTDEHAQAGWKTAYSRINKTKKGA
jgi:ATP-dependent protease ClpP protease subunit